MVEQVWAARTINVDGTDWAALVAPIRCWSFEFMNNAALSMKIRTDANNPASEFVVKAGGDYYCNLPAPATREIHAGDTLLWAQMADGVSAGTLTAFFK